MGNFLKTQNMFAFGEISPDFYAKDNILGVAHLENMDILQSGGVKRRAGLKTIGSAASESILIPFPVSETQKYLVVVYNGTIDIYHNDTIVRTLISPWTTEDLKHLQYAQRFNKLFFVHPNYPPRILTRTDNNFTLNQFQFDVNTDVSINIPCMRLEETKGISFTITNSNIDNNHAVFTASADYFTNQSVGQRINAISKQWVVESVQNARVATVYTNGNFVFPDNPVYDWSESVFSDRRGWPACITFHQNRLIFARTPTVPNGIWMSKTGDYYNFSVGTGLDDDAIYTTLLSAQHHQIYILVSSDNLQILTSVGEWAVSGSPLTPSSVDVKKHTSVGSNITRYLPPQQIEGSTVFISKSGKDIRELDLDALSEHYNATDLCSFSKHLMSNPVSMAYNSMLHRLFVVMADGEMAVLNKHPNTDIAAWGRYITDGNFKYVCVLEDTVYVIVQRKSSCYLEKFDDTCLKDAGNYGFSYKISGLPMLVKGHYPKKIRVYKISVRVMNTKSIFINNNRIEIPDTVFTQDHPGYCGDLSVNVLGTYQNTMQSLWSISSSEQLPATILSVNVDGWYQI